MPLDSPVPGSARDWLARAKGDLIVLTSFARESRYPGLGEPVTQDEYDEAIRHAAAVVAWAAAEIGQ